MNEKNENLKYYIAISLLHGIGPVTARKLISECGSAEAVIEKSSSLEKLSGLNPKAYNQIKNGSALRRAENEMEFVRNNGINILLYTDEKFPYRLKHCTDAPLLIYTSGSADLNRKRIVAVVGARKPTSYGIDQCEKIIQGLSECNVTIISGLAYGIDTIAHQSALKYGLTTFAVLGHSLDRIYPQVNSGLARKIMKDGALISEFTSGTKPDRENFPRRNRIVAGMVDLVIVVESAERGGALITADIALSYNREVMTLPGRVNDELSGGCNWLIMDNKAALIRNAKDIILMMNWDRKNKFVQKEINFEDLDDEQKRLMQIMYKNKRVGIDQLHTLSGYNMRDLPAVLLDLEMKGLIKSYPGNCYEIF